MKRLVLLVISMLLVLSAAPALADFSANDWRYHKPLQVDKDGFVMVEMDREILGRSQTGLADVRIIDSKGSEVPYQIVEHLMASEESREPQIIDNITKPDGTTQVTLDLQNTGNLHNMVSLDISSAKEYLCPVTVEGSNDNKSWGQIGTGEFFKVAAGYVQNEVSYSDSSFRYVRLTIANAHKKPLEVTGAKVVFKPRAKSSTFKVLPAHIISSKVADKQTKIIMDLGVKGYYVNKLKLHITSQNYNRSVQVEHSNNQKDWTYISSDTFYNYKWPSYSAQSNVIVLNSYCSRFLRVIIDNGDSPALPVGAIEVTGEAPRLLAELRKGEYQIWYGGAKANQPSYDLAQFSNMIDKEGLATISPGTQKANADYAPPQKPWTERNKWLLNVIIILVAATLGLVIIKNMKSSNS
ncbi:MAG: DUF3999 family protein [Acidobacteriota bacterium]